MRQITFLLSIVYVLFIGSFSNATSPAKHVVLIGFDGWGGYSMPTADMPNVKALMERGSFTMHKRSVLPSSSAPNWAAMFMGSPTEVHGYTTWGSKTPEIPTPAVNEHGIFPTIFSAVRQAHPSSDIGVVYEWETIKYLIDTLSLSYHRHGVNTPDMPDAVCRLAECYIIDKKPMLMAVCFDEPDHTGHVNGHDTPEYYSMLANLDKLVGRIVYALDQAGILNETFIIVTSDHGGINKGHGGITLQEMETPFIIAGPGIKHNYELTDLMLQQDVAATIAVLLGADIPQQWNGKPMIEAFE